MKKELEKFLREDKSLKFMIMSVETAAKMTDNQMVSWVKDYFNHVSVGS
ncbi:MAG: hypothetical protein IPL67_17980 [Ignavibacteria bacterium]|nr:hypothetical protein [Ignavibacteria bacterium]